MDACCAPSRSAEPPSPISPRIAALVGDILKRIPNLIRGAYFSAVLDAQGEVVAMENTRAERPDELLAHVARVKRAALEYASCLDRGSAASACPALHVKGASSLVSCFDIDQCVLAVFADMSAAVLESFDSRDLERQFEPMLIELQRVLSTMAP